MCGIFDGQNVTGTDSSPNSSGVNITPTQLSILLYLLGDEQATVQRHCLTLSTLTTNLFMPSVGPRTLVVDRRKKTSLCCFTLGRVLSLSGKSKAKFFLSLSTMP
jgi:hypothetical protein